MWRLCGLALAALLLPWSPEAAELTFDFTGSVNYDSNVFRRDDDAGRPVDDDALFRFQPEVKLHQDRGQDFDYSFGYKVPVEFAAKHDNRLNDVDHFAEGEVSYHPNRRLEIFVFDRYSDLRSVLNTRQVIGDIGGGQVGARLSTGRDRVAINDGRMGIRYLFGPRMLGTLRFDQRHFRTTRPDRQDNDSASVSADLLYTASPPHQVGFGLSYQYQHFAASDLVVRSQSNSINAFGQWRWQINRTLGIDIAAGPSLIQIQQPRGQMGGSQSDVDLNLFAQGGISKRWAPSLRTDLRYSRSQGTASGVGGSVIGDSVSGVLAWVFRESWELTLRGDFSRRESIGDVTLRAQGLVLSLDNRVEIQRWGIRARLDHRLARNTRIFARVLYNKQDSESSLSDANDFDNFNFSLGFSHTFEPINLW